jgi:hypothetical protein
MKLVSPLLKITNQLRIFHWQSETFAEHKAYGKAYEVFSNLVDEFIEVYMGKNGRLKAKITYNIELDNYGEHNSTYLNDFILFLTNIDKELTPQDTDLFNLRDEMLAVLNKLKYLLSLK